MKIEFIIPSYNSSQRLMTILYSLVSQTNPNWTAHVVVDSLLPMEYQSVVDWFRFEKRVRFSFIDGPNKDWGHTCRNYGIKDIKEKWVVMTGDDNYYMPLFVDDFLKAASQPRVNFVFCNMVHNNFNYAPVNCAVGAGRIDIGNAMFLSENLKGFELDKTDYNADWKLIEHYHRKYKHEKTLKIEKILYVHN